MLLTARQRSLMLGVIGFLLLLIAGSGASDRLMAMLGASPAFVSGWGWHAAAVITLVAILVFAAAFAGLVASPAPPAGLDLWEGALAALAAENGQRVRAFGARDVGFDALLGHRRFQVRIDPAPRGHLRIVDPTPARQGVAFARPPDPHRAPAADWRIVGGGRGWVLHAEVPVAARGLLDDPVLGHLLDRFFARPETLFVRHDLQGLLLESRAISPGESDRMIREWLEIVNRLRSANA